MRWFKKIVRAILALLPVLSVFLIINGDTLATSHELEGIRFAMPVVPLDYELFEGYENAGVFYQNTFSHSNGFFIGFSDSRGGLTRKSWPQNFLDNQNPRDNWFRFYSYWNGSTCVYNAFPEGWQVDYYDDIPIGWYSDDDNSTHHFEASFYYTPSAYADIASLKCNQYGIPYSATFPFQQSSLGGLFPGNDGNLVSQTDWYWDNQNPYWYSSDGFWTSERHIDTSTGQTYRSSFYLNRMIGASTNKFKTLVIPIYNSDLDSDCTGEFESGDTFTFEGAFQFDQPDFQWNPDLDNSSFFGLLINDPTHSRSASCTTNLITVENYQNLEFSCSYTFDFDPDIFVVSLRIYAGDEADYVWDASPFSFGGLKVITHNDDSVSGCKLGDDLHGAYIGGDYTKEESQEGGFFHDLSHLFFFSIPIASTPLGGLFSGYNNSQCASIPLISNLLHAEEETVCPFFTQTVRDIATPILASASVLLLFGFLVRWLSSSSGNYYEDSSTFDFNDMSYTSSHRSKRR